MSSSSGGDDKSNGLWNQLPSFDPSTDDVRKFIQKARFLHGVFPKEDKPNLAPRLAARQGAKFGLSSHVVQRDCMESSPHVRS